MNKYKNIHTLYNGRLYHSKKEAQRAWELDMLLKASQIESWHAQPKFDFVLNGTKICSYFGDFKVDYRGGHSEIEDVKGVRTDVYKIKKKLMKAFYNIDIKEI